MQVSTLVDMITLRLCDLFYGLLHVQVIGSYSQIQNIFADLKVICRLVPNPGKSRGRWASWQDNYLVPLPRTGLAKLFWEYVSKLGIIFGYFFSLAATWLWRGRIGVWGMRCGTQQPDSGLGRFPVEFLDHTHTHTPGRTPQNEWSARRKGLCLHNTQQKQDTNIHAHSGTPIRDPGIRVAPDIRLRQYGHLDRQTWAYWYRISEFSIDILVALIVWCPGQLSDWPFSLYDPVRTTAIWERVLSESRVSYLGQWLKYFSMFPNVYLYRVL